MSANACGDSGLKLNYLNLRQLGKSGKKGSRALKTLYFRALADAAKELGMMKTVLMLEVLAVGCTILWISCAFGSG